MQYRTFDTYKHISDLKSAGLPEEQARIIISSMLELAAFDLSYLATKEDIANIKEDLKRFATKEDLANVRAELKEDIANVKNDLLKWIVPLFLASPSLFSCYARH